MEPAAIKFRLRGTTGEVAGLWFGTIALGKKNGIPSHAVLPWEDVERHPENYVVSPNFIDVEDIAWQVPALETAQWYQRILKREGIDTAIA